MLDLSGAKAFDLTEITGRPLDAKRTTTVRSFDVSRRTIIAALLGAGIALPLALALKLVLGALAIIVSALGHYTSYAFLLIPLGAVAAIYFSGNDATGVSKHKQAKTALARRKVEGKFFIGDLPIDPMRAEFGWIIPNTVPNPAYLPPATSELLEA